MDLSKTHNPYDFAHPVSETNLLVGREKEMDEIKYYLDNAKTAPRPINIALLGSRASGKTSILNITELEAKARGFCTVRINFDEDDTKTHLAFFYKIFDSLITRSCQSGAFEGINGKTYETYLDAVNAYFIPEDKTFCPFSFPIQYAKAMSSGNPNALFSDQSFISDLLKIHEELTVPIVLLFDEGNVLSQSRVLLQKLRNVFMNTPGFMLVITGTPDLFPVMDDVFSPIVRQFKKINVSEFKNFEDTRQCIKKPLEKLGIKHDEILPFSDIVEIHELSAGRPYEIQFICHLLYRRLQEKRADTMKLDFSVLEDVRKELEISQDISNRPILTKVRNLGKKQLMALSILCSCNDHATFEQLWCLEYIFNGESAWTKEKLEEALRSYIDEGILKIDDDFISFRGDDFDKIYVKYFAREKGITLSFPTTSIEFYWRKMLNDFINQNLKGRLEVMSVLAQVPFTDILDVVHEMNAQNGFRDVFVDRADLAEDIYMIMMDYQGESTIPVIATNPGLPWLNQLIYYRPTTLTDLESVEEGLNLFRSLSERLAELGGNLLVERNPLPIVSIEALIGKVEQTANESLRESLASYHVYEMRKVYVDEDDREKALFHINLSSRYNSLPDAEDSNNIGYVFIGAGDLDMAEVFLKRSISLSQSNDSEEDPLFPALPMYNVGILRAERGQLESALDAILSCISLVQSVSSDDRQAVCLWVPVVNNEVLAFKEQRDPDLLETAVEAKIAIEWALAHRGGS